MPLAASGPGIARQQPGAVLVTALPNTGARDDAEDTPAPDAPVAALLLGAAAALSGSAAIRLRGVAGESGKGAPADAE